MTLETTSSTLEQAANEGADALLNGRRYAALYGEIPSSFSSLIRLLMTDQSTSGSISFSASWQLLRLLRGASFRAPVSFAVKTFHKGALSAGNHLGPKETVALFQPADLAGILGTLYLYRRARRIQETAKNDHWEDLYQQIHSRSEAGAFVGCSMERVGLGFGLLVGSLRQLGMWPFSFHDSKGFTEYKRSLRKASLPFDLAFEKERWGCTHADVASHLLISLGYSREFAEQFALGLSVPELPSESKAAHVYKVKITDVWIDSLLATGAIPDMTHSGNYYPKEDERNLLVKEVTSTRSAGSQFFWLEKGKNDFTEENLPEFWEAKSGGSAAVEQPADDAPATVVVEDGPEPEELFE